MKVTALQKHRPVMAILVVLPLLRQSQYEAMTEGNCRRLAAKPHGHLRHRSRPHPCRSPAATSIRARVRVAIDTRIRKRDLLKIAMRLRYREC